MKEIKLTKGYVAIVDDDDYEWLSKYKWHVHVGQTRPGGRVKIQARTTLHMDDDMGYRWTRIEAMHRMIADAKPGEVVDHINHDSLENCKSNLRIVTAQQNAFNQRVSKTYAGKPKTSIYKGVYLKRFTKWGKEYRYWCAAINPNGKRVTLGHFHDEEEAARAYDLKAKEIYGEHACLNFGATA